jgi:hypothetical protein
MLQSVGDGFLHLHGVNLLPLGPANASDIYNW